MKILVVSTFSDAGYTEYGKNLIESCKKYLDQNIELHLYIDDVYIENTKNLKTLRLADSIPELTDFKNRNGHRTGFKDFRWDGVRFSYKSYVMCHAAKNNDVDILIWLDADTEIINHIDQTYLLNFFDPNIFVGFLGRKGAPETGFLIFNMRDPNAKTFFNKFEWYYNSDEIYNLDQYHDAWVFQELKNEFVNQGLIKAKNITPDGVQKHPFNATFKDHMVHFKGEAKGKISK